MAPSFRTELGALTQALLQFNVCACGQLSRVKKGL